MENIKYINLKDINEDIYFISNLNIQYNINGIWINFYNNEDYEDIIKKNKNIFETIINKIFTSNYKLYNKNIKEINLKNYIEIDKYDYYTYGNYGNNDKKLDCKNLNSYLFFVLCFYILKFNKNIENDFLNILKYNLYYVDYYEINNKKEINKLFFKKNIFNDIINLNLDLQIAFKFLNSFDKIINKSISNDYIEFDKNGKKISNKFCKLTLSNNLELINIHNKLFYFNDHDDDNDIKKNKLYKNNYISRFKDEYDLLFYEILIIICNDKNNNNNLLL